jgi:spore germination protein GerM
MGRRDSYSKILCIVALCSLLLLTLFLAWGCTRTDSGVVEEQEEEVQEEEEEQEEVQPEQTVTLTLYFKMNTETEEYLAPEERTVTTSDIARSAMEELIKGPGPDSGLSPVLPNTVKVLDVSVVDGLCTVDVSKEIITDSSQLGYGARSEILALAAIANTLTDIEGIDRVKLLVEGAQSGMAGDRYIEDFWGHVGLSEFLERNEDVIYTGQDM